MPGFWVLFRTMVRQYFSLSVLSHRLRTRQNLGSLAFQLLGVLFFGGFFIYGYVKLLQAVYNMGSQLHQPGVVVLFGLLSVQLVVLLFGLFYLISVFYYSSDVENLVPLPLREDTILASKFGIVLLTEFATALPLAVPPVVLYGMRQGLGLGYWLQSVLVVALLPILPLALAAIFAVVLMRSTNLLRHRDALRVVAGLATVLVVVVIQYYTAQLGTQNADPNQVLQQLLTTPNSLVNMIGRRFPPALWGALSLVGTSATWRFLLAYLGSTVASMGFLLVVARRFFYKGLLQGATHPHAGKRRKRNLQTAITSRSALMALINREWQIIARNPIFAMTAGLNLFLPPVLLALPILGAGEQLINVKAALNDPRFYLWGSLGITALFGALAPIASIAPTAVSREGALFWFSQTIPVPPRTQLLAKLIFSVISVAVSGALMLLVAGPILGLPVNAMISGVMLGILALLVASILSLTVDVVWPRLDWYNPQQAMKGNQNVLIAMALVGGLGYLLARLVILLGKQGWSDQSILGFTAVVLLLLASVGLRYLYKLGNSLYSPRAQSTIGKARWTLNNLTRSKGRNVVNVILVIVAIFFLGKQFLIARNLDYNFDADAVRFASDEVPYNEITEVRYLEHIPTLSNRFGTEVGNYKAGTFTVEGVGRGKVIAKDASKPALLLRTEKTFYIITPDNAKERYSEVEQRVAASHTQ